MAPRSLTRFSNPIHAAPAPNDALDVAGGARTTDGEHRSSVSGVATRVSARTLA